MNCADAAERITALLDGELPAAERNSLERHLEGCAACREARAAEEAVAARLRAVPRPPLPAGFSARVMGRVAAAPSPVPSAAGEGAAPPSPASGRILRFWPFLFAGAAAAAGILAMVMVGPGGPSVRHLADKAPVAPGSGPAAGGGEALDDREADRDSLAVADASVPAAAEPLPAGGPEAEAPEAAVAGRPAREGAWSEEDRRERSLAEDGAGFRGPAGEVPPDSRAPGEPPTEGGADGRADATKGEDGEKGLAEEAKARVPEAPAAPIPAPSKAAAPEGGGGAGGGPPPAPGASQGAGRKEEGRKPKGPPTPGDRTRAGAPLADRGAADLPRRAIFYRVDALARGQRAVETTLFGLKDFTCTRDTWKRPAEVDSEYGRLVGALEKAREERAAQAAGTGGAAARGEEVLPGERVLELRLRGRDAERLRAALRKDPALRETHAQDLGEDEGIPEVLADRIRRLAAEAAAEDLKEAGLEVAGKDAPGGAERGPAEGPALAPEKGDRFLGGLAGAREPGEPVPPPPPTAKQLEALAGAPRPESASRSGSVGGADELILEIHLFEAPAPPAATLPEGGAGTPAPPGGGK